MKMNKCGGRKGGKSKGGRGGCRLFLLALLSGIVCAGCRVVEVENKGEEIARDAEGKPVLTKDGTIQTVKKGWSVYHNQHWMWTQLDAMSAQVKPDDIQFSMGNLNSQPSSNLVALVDTSFKGACELTARIGAAIATGGGSVAGEAGAAAITALVQRFIAKGGDASKATITCQDGSCTLTDGSVSEACTDCYVQ